MIRDVVPEDAPMLARLHVQCWRETYTGLLPEEEIAARPYEVRRAQWENQIAAGTSRIAVLPDLGFAQAGPQRDGPLSTDWPEELYCLYLLKVGQGLGQGRTLFEAVRGQVPLTALVLDTNEVACRFYERAGGVLLETRPEHIGQVAISERVYGFR
ncbi:GNAT family N-acetyltransferase [Pelagovum pacificum]|uniref:GNAT family N-acetyltransferase n=1 Tax=Pelagovum pacificum TaxID=2588711 RepID=A0A5C5GLL0_9RHOB|nr:GNAT family N-acetyltransferase [Pelagovum pacificum]QQA42633.1 hypothetical protein I8N54_17935 [Pelagovum pacificum]TNY34216.1 GNAT family N-acetyltransferase [Pelagovum pacificum]